jgi:hypothetical protein
MPKQRMFQVIVSGDGTLGTHAVRPCSVHFARAHTPYGPITAGPNGLSWLTIRARRDAEGAQFLPEKRDQLEQVTWRNPWQISQDSVFADFDGDVSLRDSRGPSHKNTDHRSLITLFYLCRKACET